MNQGIYPLAATMINQLNRVDVLSNNLANATTNAFKQDNVSEGSFNHYLKKAQDNGLEITKIDKITNTIPKIDTKFISGQMGVVVPTENQMDFAIKSENIFFKIQNPKTKEIVLSRDGSFNVLGGQLVNKNGFNVLDTKNVPIVIEEGSQKFALQIAVVKTDYTNLDKQGNNNYKIKDQKQVEKLIGNEDYVLRGALEKSNVNSVTTMVGLIDSHRRFEQAQKAMTGIDELNQKVIDKIGSNR